MIDKFDREKSDFIFTETLEDIDNLNTRDGKFEYSDYITLHNDITALYDSFSHVDEIIDGLRQQLAESERREKAAVADLHGYCKACINIARTLDFDELVKPICRECNKIIKQNWQWRGVEKGDNK